MNVAIALVAWLAALVVSAWLAAKAIRRAEPELEALHQSALNFKTAMMSEFGRLLARRRKA
jgi:hypothetical protein